MNEGNRSSLGTCCMIAALAMVLIGLCGGCLFLAILANQGADAARAKSRHPLVDAAKAAVEEHFGGNVRIVSTTLDRPADNGFLVAGRYEVPGDQTRDFLATVVPTDNGCKVVHLIVDGDVVLPKP